MFGGLSISQKFIQYSFTKFSINKTTIHRHTQPVIYLISQMLLDALKNATSNMANNHQSEVIKLLLLFVVCFYTKINSKIIICRHFRVIIYANLDNKLRHFPLLVNSFEKALKEKLKIMI